MEQESRGLMVFALVGASRPARGGFKLHDLAENVANALAKGEWVRLGFYDWGYPQSVDFFPTKSEEEDNVKPLRWTKVFAGEVGREARTPACLIISQRDGEVDAVVTYARIC